MINRRTRKAETGSTRTKEGPDLMSQSEETPATRVRKGSAVQNSSRAPRRPFALA
jgi:hypothetical protein